MTEASFKLAGEKRGWKKIGEVKPAPTEETIVQKEMRRLKEERAAKDAQQAEKPSEEDEIISEQVKEEPKKRGPKPKKNEA